MEELCPCYDILEVLFHKMCSPASHCYSTDLLQLGSMFSHRSATRKQKHSAAESCLMSLVDLVRPQCSAGKTTHWLTHSWQHESMQFFPGDLTMHRNLTCHSASMVYLFPIISDYSEILMHSDIFKHMMNQTYKPLQYSFLPTLNLREVVGEGSLDLMALTC